MWPFWRTRDRFSLEELRYLTDHLQKVHAVNQANQDVVIEALRSIAEIMIYGDQHDPSLFEYFMEKQIMGEFARVLRISNLSRVSLQLLQTMGIMIQNLRDEHSVDYILSSEHIDFFITYPFDFWIEEMVSYYISFLRAISGKLNKDTISLLVKMENDEVTSFPLYVEALKFAFHQDSMIRVAVRTLTLNVYHVGDESVNRFVSRVPLSDYFSDMVQHFQKQCINLDKLVAHSSGTADSFLQMCCVEDAIVQIEDTLYYFSDVMSSGIPDLERFIIDNILQALVFRLLLPSLQRQSTGLDLSVTTSMYLLCCILHILKNKDMASTVAAALFHQPDCPDDRKQGTPHNNYKSEHDYCISENHCTTASAVEQSIEDEPNSLSSASWKRLPNHSPLIDCCHGNTPREHLLSYITQGDDSQALGSLCVFATLLQTKELDESMLDALGILPQRKQHKKLLLQALVGEDLDEGQLFSSSSGLIDDNIHSDFDIYVRKLQDKYGLQCNHPQQMTSKAHRYQVLDALVDVFCRSKVSAGVRLVGGWLFRQLLPRGEEEFTAFHLRRLKDLHEHCSSKLSEESAGCWHDTDMFLPIIKEAWRNCKKEIEASSVAIADGVYEIVKHCILASCTIAKVDEDCPEGSPTKYLVGEDLDEGQLFSSSSGVIDDSIHSDFDIYVRKLQDKYGLQCHHPWQMTSKAHRYQVLDALLDIFCRSKVSADVRLVGGWLFRQLLPHGEEEFTAFHLRRLKDSHKDFTSKLSEESSGCWCDTDMLLPIINEAWRNCKKQIEASSVAIAEGVYEIVKHCILASCRISKVDEDCPEGSPTKYLEYPPCISKDIELYCWCKQPMGAEDINTNRMEEYSHSYTFRSYKLQLLTVLNNCYKLQQLNMLNT